MERVNAGELVLKEWELKALAQHAMHGLSHYRHANVPLVWPLLP